MSVDAPLWFPSTELLTSVLHAEFNVVTQLLVKYPDLPDLFETPDTSVPQRETCFALLAHRKLIETILNTLTGRYEQPSISDVESDILRRTHSLVTDDAPAWALEIQRVIARLPAHIFTSLPEPLRRGGFNSKDAEQMESIRSAAKTLSSVEQIQVLTEHVIDHQLQRLEGRWAVARPVANLGSEIIVRGPLRSKRKGRRTRDKLRISRDEMIAGIDDVSPTIGEFLKLMDERNVQPQPTWGGWPGSWLQAYKDPRLRKLIHQDKSRALARSRRERNR